MFNIGDKVIIVSAGSIYTREERVGWSGEITEIFSNFSASICSDRGTIHAALSDLEHVKETNHLDLD